MSSPADQPTPAIGRDPTVAARVEQMYASHGALVRSICGALLRDRSEADDAVQQTFLSAQRALLNGSSPRDAAAWLATIARHESLARIRARMREPLPVEVGEHEASAPDAHAAAVDRQETGELRNALAELPSQQRQAILLRELRGFSYQEVASSLAVTTSAVESLLFRARRSLKIRLQAGLGALAPVAWIRELAGSLGGGGLAGSAAAKVAAVGLGTAVATGGALVAPTVIGLGHAPRPRVAAAPASTPPHRAPGSAASKPAVWSPAAPHPARVVAVFHPRTRDHLDGSDSGSRTEISDKQRSSDTQERDVPASGTTGSTAGDRSAHETSDAGTTSHETSDSRDGSSTDSGADPTTTDQTTTDQTTTDQTTTDSGLGSGD